MITGMTDTTAAIADKVRGVAAEKRFTQKRIAETLDLSRTSIVERYGGRVPYTGVELFELAEAMHVPVTRFFPEAVKA